jgi:hypothetical protein
VESAEVIFQVTNALLDGGDTMKQFHLPAAELSGDARTVHPAERPVICVQAEQYSLHHPLSRDQQNSTVLARYATQTSRGIHEARS